MTNFILSDEFSALRNEAAEITLWLTRHPYIADFRNPERKANNNERIRKHARRAEIWRIIENRMYETN